MPQDRMRYAMSGHEFRHTPPHPEAGIKMAARYGYHGLEPFQEDIAKYLEKPPAALKEVLDASGLALCTVGSGGHKDRRYAGRRKRSLCFSWPPRKLVISRSMMEGVSWKSFISVCPPKFLPAA